MSAGSLRPCAGASDNIAAKIRTTAIHKRARPRPFSSPAQDLRTDMNESVSLFTAFIAGIVSFISPCVLPIVPGYLSFISGINVAKFKNQETPKDQARRVAITSLFFVLGFSTVFVALGAAATMVGYYLQQYKRL